MVQGPPTPFNRLRLTRHCIAIAIAIAGDGWGLIRFLVLLLNLNFLSKHLVQSNWNVGLCPRPIGLAQFEAHIFICMERENYFERKILGIESHKHFK